MGFVKTILNGPGSASKVQGADPAQMNTAYAQTQASIKQQQDFVNALQAQNGLGNQSSVFQQQQGLSDQFGQVAQGQGPNPAQAQLAQATGANVANQAALMAGQRGAGANVGLMARQAAQQGGNLQQQAVGQGATMQAQQSMAAMGQQQQQQANMAGLANQQVVNQQQGNANLGQQSLGQQSNLMGLQQNANTANAGLQGQQLAAQYNMIGNIAGAVGGAAVKAAADGGNVSQLPSMSQQPGPKSSFGRMLHGIQMAQGGKVPALVSPGEQYIPPKDISKVKQGANPLAVGERIPGKPKHPGNNYANDTVPKTLEEGGIVIPNAIMQSKDATKKAAEFVAAVLAKKSLPKKSSK